MSKKKHPAKPGKGPPFPAPVGEFDDNLNDEQRMKLEVGGSGESVQHRYLGRAVVASTAGTVKIRTWECHDYIIPQGDPCPECGKKHLLD